MDNVEIYNVETRPEFDKRFERLSVKKKFKTLPDQIDEIISKMEKGEFEGDKITHQDFPTPYDVYKLRLPNPDTRVGKLNGYRVIYLVRTENKIVVLMTMYYKKEDATVSDKYVNGLIDGYFLHSLPEED